MIGTEMTFYTCTGIHIVADGCSVQSTSNYTISGNALAYMQLVMQAYLAGGGNTVTLSGTPAWTYYFIDVESTSVCSLYATTYSGAATGVRYRGVLNSVIQTYGGGANYFPGNAAGSVATGAQYS